MGFPKVSPAPPHFYELKVIVMMSLNTDVLQQDLSASSNDQQTSCQVQLSKDPVAGDVALGLLCNARFSSGAQF
jgi:hypothetical protein